MNRELRYFELYEKHVLVSEALAQALLNFLELQKERTNYFKDEEVKKLLTPKKEDFL